MSAILKALGLKEDASEEEALKAIAEMAKARRKENGNGNGNGDKDEEEEDDDDEEEKEKKAMKALPASIREKLEKANEAINRVAKLEQEAALVAFTKKAVDAGFAPSEGVTLQKAYAGDKEAIDKIVALSKTGWAAAKEAGAFKEFGAAGTNGNSTAFEQFTALAQAYLKAHPGEGLSESQAFTKVYEDPANKVLRIQDANETGRGRTA